MHPLPKTSISEQEATVIDYDVLSEGILHLPDRVTVYDDLTCSVEYNRILHWPRTRRQLRPEQLTVNRPSKPLLLTLETPKSGNEPTMEFLVNVSTGSASRSTPALRKESVAILSSKSAPAFSEIGLLLDPTEAELSPAITVISPRQLAGISRSTRQTVPRLRARLAPALTMEIPYKRSSISRQVPSTRLKSLESIEFTIKHPPSILPDHLVLLGSFRLSTSLDINLNDTEYSVDIDELLSGIPDHSKDALHWISNLINMPNLDRETHALLVSFHQLIDGWRRRHLSGTGLELASQEKRQMALREWADIESRTDNRIEIPIAPDGRGVYFLELSDVCVLETTSIRVSALDRNSAERHMSSLLLTSLGVLQLGAAWRYSSQDWWPSVSFLRTPEAEVRIKESLDAVVALLTLFPGAFYLQSLFSNLSEVQSFGPRPTFDSRTLSYIGAFLPLVVLLLLIGNAQPTAVAAALLVSGLFSSTVGLLTYRYSSPSEQTASGHLALAGNDRRQRKGR